MMQGARERVVSALKELGQRVDAGGQALFDSRQVAEALYRGILGRSADEGGLAAYVTALNRGAGLPDVVASFVRSDEFNAGREPARMLGHPLPDLTVVSPESYTRLEDGSALYWATTDEDFRRIEALIREHRYYDSFGVWNPEVDLDKRITAAIVQGLGARSCLEPGCFSGAVLSVLASRGIEVCGVEVSHLAMVLALPDVHRHIRFGDLLSLEFGRRYDVVLAMDILEHLSPIDLDRYVQRLASLMEPDGFIYLNSPMFGADDVFGTAAQVYRPEWRAAGDGSCWRHLHCDARGWPLHGHLVWASPRWWESLFVRNGLERDREIERVIHSMLGGFFDRVAPARRSLFVLRRAGARPDVTQIASTLRKAIGVEWPEGLAAG